MFLNVLGDFLLMQQTLPVAITQRDLIDVTLASVGDTAIITDANCKITFLTKSLDAISVKRL